MLKKLLVTITALVMSAALTLTSFAEVTPVIGSNSETLDADAINNAKLLIDTSADPANGGWFNVGMNSNTAAASVSENTYIAPTGGIEVAGDEIELRNKQSGIARKIAAGANPTSGIYEIKFSVKTNGACVAVDASGDLDLFKFRPNGTPANKRSIILYTNGDGKIFISQAAHPLINASDVWQTGTFDTQEYLDVSATYNMDESAVKIIIKQNGKIVSSAVTSLAGVGDNIKNNGLGYIRIIGTDEASGEAYANAPAVRNFTVNKLDSAKDVEFSGFGDTMQYGPKAITSSYATASGLKQAGWSIDVKTGYTYAMNNSALEIQSGGTTGGAAVHTKARPAWEDAPKGKLRFCYRIKVEGETSGATIRANLRGVDAGGAVKPQSIQFGTDGQIKAAGLTNGTLGTGDVAVLGRFDKSEWIEVEEYLDTNEREYSVTVKQNGAVIAQKDKLVIRDEVAQNGVDSIHFIFNSAKADTKLTIDEVMLEQFSAASVPMEISDASVTITDIENYTVTAAGSKVSPAIEKISIDFGSDMPAPTAAAGIELRGADGAVKCEIAASKDNSGVWDVIPKGLLDNNSEYTLYIPQGITDADGRTLEKDYTAVFSTLSLEEACSMNGLFYDDGTQPDGIDGLGGRTVTADTTVINLSDDKKDLVWLLAYYDENDACVRVECINNSVDGRNWLRTSEMPQFSAGKPSGAVRASVMFWDGHKSIKPYCPSVEVGKTIYYDASAVFGKSDKFANMGIEPAMATESYNGGWGKRLTSKNLYMRCNVDNNVMYDLQEGTYVDVVVEYFDGDSGYFSIQYDSTNPDTTLYSGNTVYSQAELVQFEGTHEWKTHTFRLKDMKMSDRVSGSDFRIAAFVYKQGTSPEDVLIGSVRVKYSEEEEEQTEEEKLVPTVNVTGQDAKTNVSVSFSEGVMYLSGEAESDTITIEILKAEKAGSEDINGDDILDARQISTPVGKLDLKLPIAVKNSGKYILRIRKSKGETEEIPLYLNSKDGLKGKYDELQKAAAKGASDLAAYLNENIEALNFKSSFIDGELSEDDVSGYMNYVKSNPLTLNSAEDEVKNSETFKLYTAMTKINNGEFDNVTSLIEEANIGGEKFAELYGSIVDKEKEQKYFAKVLSDNSIDSAEKLETAAKQALVLTAVKYAGGTDEIKKAVEEYASEIGVSYTSSDEVYRELIGKEITTIPDFIKAYNSAKESVGGNGGNGGNGGGGGRGGAGGITLGKDINAAAKNADLGGYNTPNPISRTFIDLDSVVWAAEAILALADKNIINGVDSERFAPDDSVSREAFVKMLVGALGMSDEPYETGVFSDVKPGDWFEKYVNIAYKIGIVNGVGDDMFGIGRSITREDMAVMLYNALKYRQTSMDTTAPGFEDFGDISAYAADAVSALYNLGAVNGMTETTFEPKGTATRAQAAKIIYGVFDQLNR